MGIFRDLIDAVADIGDFVDKKEDIFKRGATMGSSLSKQSLEGTLQFPVIVTKSLDIDAVQMVSKALERQYASFLQVVLTMNPTMKLDKDHNAAGYLRKFHQNSDVKTDMYDVGNAINRLAESYDVYSNDQQNVLVMCATFDDSTNKVVTENLRQLHNVLEGVRRDVLNNKFVPHKMYNFGDDNLNNHYNSYVSEASTSRTGRNPQSDKNVSKGQTRKDDKSGVNSAGNVDNKNHRNDNNQETIKPIKIELPNNILKDNDVRKANELVPTTMQVRYRILNKEDEDQGTVDFIAGVKTTIHPVPSDEIVSNLLDAAKNKNGIFNFIRWTTGEIGFFKDFLFNISSIKNDVVSRSHGASNWWIALKRRRALSKMKANMFLSKRLLPNASIVVSAEEVEFMKANYGIDLMKESFAYKIMKEYFLLSLVVVDNSTQIAHFLFDGQQSFQSVPFTGLERDNHSGSGVNMKDVLKLVQRV